MDKIDKIDKIPYTQVWYNIIIKLYTYKMDAEYRRYCIGIDTFILTLLPDERKKVREYMKSIEEPNKFPEKTWYYDNVLEYIIDTLEDAGYLTRSIIIQEGGTFTGKVDKHV